MDGLGLGWLRCDVGRLVVACVVGALGFVIGCMMMMSVA